MNGEGFGRLCGKTAIVTGATVGIGRATAVAFAREGASVALVGRNLSRLGEALEAVWAEAPEASLLPIAADVRRESDMEAMAEETLARFGKIDILVASAGILRAPGSTLRLMAQMSLPEWDDVVDTNLKGMFLSNRAVLPSMIAQRSGHIVNVSSTSGRKGYAFDTAYCASKFGAIGLSQALAEEVRGYGIKVQILLPGAIDTPIWEQNGPFRRPDHALPAERVADVLVYMVTLPEDTLLEGVVVEPFGQPPREGWLGAPGSRKAAQVAGQG